MISSRPQGLLFAVVLWAGACGGAHPQDLVPRALPRPDATDGLTPLRAGVNLAAERRIVDYAIDARLDPASHRITATSTVTIYNRGFTDITEIPFHLYLNAFKNEDSVFMQEAAAQGKPFAPTAWGWIDVEHIRIDGVDHRAAAAFVGPDETVLSLALQEPLVPGGKLSLEMTFVSQLPEAMARTGFAGAFHLVSQWYPKVGKRVGAPGAEAWHCPPFHHHSEFYADFGNYQVTMRVPSTYGVFATGMLRDAVADGGEHKLTFVAEMVHDFAWVADPWLQETAGTAMVAGVPVRVRVVHRPGQRDFAARHLQAAIGAIEFLSREVYAYPWSTMTIVDPPPEADATAGMEYPTFVTTAGDSAHTMTGVRLPEFVTIHEVAHNWFQGLLATDEGQAPWLDEGLNDWIDTVIMDDLYGRSTSGLEWRGMQANVQAIYRAIASAGGTLQATAATAPAHHFADAADYGGQIYNKVALALMTLEKHVGRERLLIVLQAWAGQHAFGHPTADDFFATLAIHFGEPATTSFRQALATTAPFTVAIRSAHCRDAHAARGIFGAGTSRTTIDAKGAPSKGAFTCDVTLVRSEPVWTPVTVEFRFADGSSFRDTWAAPSETNKSLWHRFTFGRSVPLREVVVDPDNHLMLNTNLLATQLRLAPDMAASARAGARAAHWTQTMMQVVGL